MRICLVVSIGLIGGCGADGAPVDPGDPDFVLPTMRGSDLPGEAVFGGPQDLPASCLTRYDFAAASVPDAECRRELVGGNPDHAIVTCPVHPQLATTTEVERAGDGRVLREVIEYVGSNHGVPYSATTYRYEGQLLTGIDNDRDRDGLADWTSVISTRDDEDRALTMAITAEPWEFLGVEYPQTARQQLTLHYDAAGRVLGKQIRFVETGAVFYELSVNYDDPARRREWQVIVDDSSVNPLSGGAGVNGGYELFGAGGELIERSWFHPDGATFVEYYRYDEQQRQITKVFEAAGSSGYTAREVYSCP